MAVAQGSRGFSESFDGFVAPQKNLSVPNHLLDTKIYSKVAQNDVLQTKPSVVHFAGFKVGEKQTQVVKIANASSETQKMHIIPPTSKYFYIKYTKNERLVPGLYLEVTIEFTPDEWRYYYDCIRIHSKAEENLLIPIHAYPVMTSLNFPKEIHFAPVPLGKSKSKALPLRSDIPVDFEFQLNCLQSNPAFTVGPMSGVVPGGGETSIQVTFQPVDFSTAILKLQLLISQFNSEPLICTITGTSQPGLNKKSSETQITPEITTFPNGTVLDPRIIDPLGRTRIKKLKTKPWIPDDQKPKTVGKEGYLIPASGNLNTNHAISNILSQQQGKLKAKDIREAVQSNKSFVGSSKQMKETVFEYQVHQNVQEERQNQLRWCVRLGEDALTDDSKNQILESRLIAEREYKLNRGDPVIENEFDRSRTGCQSRRVHRQATEVPQLVAKFDVLVNDEWSKRHMVTKKFVQAARKIIIRLRASKNAHSLTDFVSGWRKGKFTKDQTRSQMAESEEERILTRIPSSFNPVLVHPFSFPAYKSPDTKDDMDVDALGVLSVPSTLVKVKTNVPYHNLKVPKQYSVLGYTPHSVTASSSGYVPPNLGRSLRIGAQDELVNLPSQAPIVNQVIPGAEEDEDVFDDRETASPTIRSPIPDALQDETVSALQPEVVPLVVPAAMFKPVNYHPMHIFNPAPGLQVYKPQLPYSEVDEDYHANPLPRYRQPNRSATSGKPGRRYLERQDIIPGVMTWKRFPCQTLVSMGNQSTLSSIWLPRWTDPFNEDVLPTELPPLLDGLPEDDVVSDDEFDDDGDLIEVPVPTPEMVQAQFPMADNIVKDSDHPPAQLSDVPTKQQSTSTGAASSVLVSRAQRERELNDFLRQRQNRLGSKIDQRVASMYDLLKSSDLKLK